MIYMRFEQIGEDPDAIQLHRKPIATFFLWVTRVEILDGLLSDYPQSDTTRHQFLELWDKIHLANPAPAAIYLVALLRYIDVDQGRVMERPGSEQGARVASLCLLRALSSVDPTSPVLEDIRKSYVAVIPCVVNFEGLHCYDTINAIHAVLVGSRLREPLPWMDYMPSVQERIFTNTLARVAHKRKGHGKVPRWLLHFVTHSLTHDPQPPISFITDCLTIIAIDLGCDISEDDVRNVDKRYECLAQLHSPSC